MTASTITRPVSVDELRRAWQAVQDGQFRKSTRTLHPREHQRAAHPSEPGQVWAPEEPVIPVLGCHGHAGATTLALALATAAAPARLIECASATTTGLAAAATAELGTSDRGWRVGRRDDVWIARLGDAYRDIGSVPIPDPPAPEAPPATMTVVDVGWDVCHVLDSRGWVNATVTAAPALVLAATATVPGLRRLERGLTRLTNETILVAVLGPTLRRWPRHVRATTGPLTRAVIVTGRLVSVPVDRHLTSRGPDGADLPASLLAAADQLLDHLRPTERDSAVWDLHGCSVGSASDPTQTSRDEGQQS